MPQYILSIDQGTTNSRALIFNLRGEAIAESALLLTQTFPQDGWVEQDPDEMFIQTLNCCRSVLQQANLTPDSLIGVGIANQRETTLIWDKKTGKTIYPAIVWQDRRTSGLCEEMASHPIAKKLQQKTGLLLDPYFSATKIHWILEHVPLAKEKALNGDLLFGTVDTYLIWRFTNGASHVTDVSNASRTLLFNIQTLQWDKDILSAFNIPEAILPRVLNNTADFGLIEQTYLGSAVPILGVAGDQQAATIGQACFHPGMTKATYGTGSFLLMNTGAKIIQSQNKLLSTILYRLKDEVVYGLEGSIFCAGVTIKWLRDQLQLIKTASESEALAKSLTDNGNVYCVPAFTGLGAPYWRPDARGAFVGLTRNSERAHFVRAALESVAYQSKDLIDAMMTDSQIPIQHLRVDGGMTKNTWFLQFLADMCDVSVERSSCIETTALGVAYLVGLQVGVFANLQAITDLWHESIHLQSNMNKEERALLYQNWKVALQRVL